MIGAGFSLTECALRRRRRQVVFDFLAGVLPAGVQVSRSTVASYVTQTGMLALAPANTARFARANDGALRGLLVEGPATNLLTQSRAALGAGWVQGASTSLNLTLGALGQFAGVSVASNGQTWHRLVHQAEPTVVAATAHTVTVYFRAGTSGRLRMILRAVSTGTETQIGGTIGALAMTQQAAGAITNVAEQVMPDGLTRRLTCTFTPNATGPLSLGIGPDSVSGTVQVLGAQIEAGGAPSSFIFSAGAATTRTADLPAVTGVTGVRNVRLTYGDGSTQTLSSQTIGPGYWPPMAQTVLRRLEIL